MPKPAETTGDFGERLTLALKALNLSRGQLAAQVGVDKSLVSRWANGQMTPTGHNLARISEVLAKAKPGFNALLWERPRAQFDAFLGIEAPADEAPPERSRAAPESPAGAFRWPRWSPYAATGAGALVLAIGLGALWPGLASRPGPAAVAVQPASSGRIAIAVLPFANLSGDAARDYFSDGFSDELLNRLGATPGLSVASRTDSFFFKGKAVGTGEIARQLKVRYVLEGSVREAGGRIRVDARLIDSQTGQSVWAQSFDRALTDVLKMQDDIARAIASQLTHQLLPGGAAAARPIDPEAYRTFLLAKSYAYIGTAEGLDRGIALLKTVTDKAPDFAEAQVELANNYLVRESFDARHKSDWPLAEAALKRALAKQPDNPMALALMVNLMGREWRWREAVAGAEQLMRAPGASEEMKVFAAQSLYFSFGLYGPAVASGRALAERRPDDYLIRFAYAQVLAQGGDYGASAAQTREALVLRPGNPLLLTQLCQAQAYGGDIAAARATQAQLAGQGGPSAGCAAAIAARTGDLAALRALADRQARAWPGDGSVSAGSVALRYLQALDFDDALAWYRRSYDLRESDVLLAPYERPEVVSPAARKLFDDPRWKALWAQAPVQDWARARADFAATPLGRGWPLR